MAATQEFFIGELDNADNREVVRLMFQREPGLVFDVLEIFTGGGMVGHHLHMYHLGAPVATAGRCLQTEGKCCGQGPDLCVSLLPHFANYCLDNGYLHLHRRHRVDVLAVADAAEPGDDAREYRHAAYTQFVPLVQETELSSPVAVFGDSGTLSLIPIHSTMGSTLGARILKAFGMMTY